jgi:hypothetical protein
VSGAGFRVAAIGPALEDQVVGAEEADFCEQPQQMVLGDIEEGRIVGVGPSGAVAENQRG